MLGQYNYPLYNPNAPMQSQWQMPNMYQQPIKIPRVNGKDGANAYDMPRSSEVLLLDLNDPMEKAARIQWYITKYTEK